MEAQNKRKSWDPVKLSKNVRKFRKHRHLRQEDLAEAIGANVNTISRIEHGGSQCSLETLLLISSALHVSPDMLLEGNFDAGLRHFEHYLHTVSTEIMDFFDRTQTLLFRQLRREHQIEEQSYRYQKERLAAERSRSYLDNLERKEQE
ncbi:MAG: helix-turn-helix domain-containing protein [Oribacterium sp.]